MATHDIENIASISDPAGVGTLLSDRLDGVQPDGGLPVESCPFQRSQMPAPRALYKSYSDETSGGASCQNWRWVR
jgi:hypothetical protein